MFWVTLWRGDSRGSEFCRTGTGVVHVVLINCGQLFSYLGTSGTRIAKNSTGHLETHMALKRGMSIERLYVIVFLCLYGELGGHGKTLPPEGEIMDQMFCQTSGKTNSYTCVPIDEAAKDRTHRSRAPGPNTSSSPVWPPNGGINSPPPSETLTVSPPSRKGSSRACSGSTTLLRNDWLDLLFPPGLLRLVALVC